jgi:hypothetical protein
MPKRGGMGWRDAADRDGGGAGLGDAEARESLRVRQRGAVKAGGGARPFIGVGGHQGGGRHGVTTGV